MSAQGRRELKPPLAVVIDPALLAEFQALRSTRPGAQAHVFTAEEDKLMLMFWPHKDKHSMSKQLKCHESTAREHYRALAQADPARARELAEEGRKLCSQ